MTQMNWTPAKNKEEMDKKDIWNPPSAARARLRLMVLWSNAGRSFLEFEYADDPEGAKDKFELLQKWVLHDLSSETTEYEKERHGQSFGSWDRRDIVDDSWDTEAGQSLLWALGLLQEMPSFDEDATWGATWNEFNEFPSAGFWHPELTLCAADEIEEMARTYETIFWRIREGPSWNDGGVYVRRFLSRANRLGHVKLASDGDLALSDGSSLALQDEGVQTRLGSICCERLKGLNWLCGQEENWDDITADTVVGWLWDENWPEP